MVSWSRVCSDHGADMMKTGGSAVDAAIATWLCVAVTHSQSDGVGGYVSLYAVSKNCTKK